MKIADCSECYYSAPLRSFSAVQYKSSFPLIDAGCLQPSNFHMSCRELQGTVSLRHIFGTFCGLKATHNARGIQFIRILKSLKVRPLNTSCSGDQVQFKMQSISSRSGSRFDIDRVGLNGDLHTTEQPGRGLPEPTPMRKLICQRAISSASILIQAMTFELNR